MFHCHWGGGESHLGPCSPDPFESVLFWDKGEVFSPVRVGSCGIKPSFIRFFCFIRRFWNQIFTWKGIGLGERLRMIHQLREFENFVWPQVAAALELEVEGSPGSR